MSGVLVKTVRVVFDEALLERLDSDPAVRERGRSAVLREAARDFLRRRETEGVDRRYAAGYGGSDSVGTELRGWDQEGAWPESWPEVPGEGKSGHTGSASPTSKDPL